ncbi:SSU ribosomal protein S17p (S11e) [hydrothermal vent metagenome]|uniref:SSU ribosomal protein S17p (S11e) n=1 Tax=hydrothermal vent metagenome TaxID=652676 RepID=A0A3B1CLR4_9ZZZZ
MTEEKTVHKKTRTGVVVSDKMSKTAIVKVDRRSPHPVFKKVVTRSKRYYVHDEENKLKVGDRVTIVETRPLSKLKRWRLGEILQRAAG